VPGTIKPKFKPVDKPRLSQSEPVTDLDTLGSELTMAGEASEVELSDLAADQNELDVHQSGLHANQSDLTEAPNKLAEHQTVLADEPEPTATTEVDLVTQNEVSQPEVSASSLTEPEEETAPEPVVEETEAVEAAGVVETESSELLDSGETPLPHRQVLWSPVGLSAAIASANEEQTDAQDDPWDAIYKRLNIPRP
jgi:hypothetical protein